LAWRAWAGAVEPSGSTEFTKLTVRQRDPAPVRGGPFGWLWRHDWSAAALAKASGLSSRADADKTEGVVVRQQGAESTVVGAYPFRGASLAAPGCRLQPAAVADAWRQWCGGCRAGCLPAGAEALVPTRARTWDLRINSPWEAYVISVHHQLRTASAHLRHRSRMQCNAGVRKTALLRFCIQVAIDEWLLCVSSLGATRQLLNRATRARHCEAIFVKPRALATDLSQHRSP